MITGTVLTAVMSAAPAVLMESSSINLWVRVLVLPLLVLGVASSLSMIAGVWAQQRSALVDQGERLNELFARSRADSELLQTVIDTVGVGILVIDADGRYESMNAAQERLNRLVDPSGRADSIDHDGYVFALDRTTSIPMDERAECRAVRGESFADATYWVGPKPATRRALSISANQLRDDSGRPRCVVLAYHDVTDHLQALRIKNEFLASVTHELRTPLTSIIGYLELIEDHSGELEADVRGFWRVIQRNAERLLALVSDLLTTAQTEAGVLRLNLTDTDLREVLERSVDTAQVRADSQGVQLRTDLSAVPLLRADPGRLYQVIDNVLSNAIKYTPRGGEVAVDLWEDEDADAVFLTVSDTGIGINETDLADVFTRFFRASDVERRAIPGVGLGLAISKDMVEAHGGTVELGSVVGRGTTVTISLPRHLLAGAEQLASAQTSLVPPPASSVRASR